MDGGQWEDVCELSAMKGSLQELIFLQWLVMKKKFINQASWIGIYIHEHFLTLKKDSQRALLGVLLVLTKWGKGGGIERKVKHIFYYTIF